MIQNALIYQCFRKKNFRLFEFNGS